MPVPPPAVEFVGSIFADSGYGEASRLYVTALLAAGVPVTIAAYRRGEFDDEIQGKYAVFGALVGRKDIKPVIRIVNQTPAFARDTAAKLTEEFPGPVVQLTTWETDRLPPVCVKSCNTFDAVWVPTKWNGIALKQSGVTKPIRVFPHPHGPQKYDVPKGYEDDQDAKYTFYWIGAWSERKNPLGALRAYFHAFCGWKTGDPLTPYPNVRLVLKTGGTSGVEADIAAQMRVMWPDETTRPPADVSALKAAFPEVVLINDNTWGREQVDALHLHSNCLVALSRAEGWNLPLYEGLLWGNQAIYSDFGGHEWVPDDCPTAHPINRVTVPCQSDPQSQLYNGSQLWVEPDLGQAAQAMRMLAGRRPPKKDVRGKFAAYTFEAVGRAMADELARMAAT